ncbi:hypothetical protein HYH03_016713 [Edaphochlamys debaryana]|uniref:Uncharacterized protein n=1 Tax=Edaphochlamys debaryana TaxID=47281 RepID=A0A836BPV0_9CHLO|nr:hypothetical protein HYH03_016713 [Edaphochlamys debaryana]|eukprot:KAG2484480.1 hypothetical protein HYH03_016713 [Edaphochlamys debaryana]
MRASLLAVCGLLALLAATAVADPVECDLRVDGAKRNSTIGLNLTMTCRGDTQPVFYLGSGFDTIASDGVEVVPDALAAPAVIALFGAPDSPLDVVFTSVHLSRYRCCATTTDWDTPGSGTAALQLYFVNAVIQSLIVEDIALPSSNYTCAVEAYGGSLTIESARFRSFGGIHDDSAGLTEFNPTARYWGATAIRAHQSAKLDLRNAVFEDMLMENAPTLWAATGAELRITNSTWRNLASTRPSDESSESAAAVLASGTASVTIRNCTFANFTDLRQNVRSVVSVIHPAGEVTIENSTWAEITALSAVSVEGLGITTLQNLTFRNVTGGAGAAIYLGGSLTRVRVNPVPEQPPASDGAEPLAVAAALVEESTFERTTATDTGGAILVAGLVAATIRNSSFVGCSSAAGGAISVTGSGGPVDGTALPELASRGTTLLEGLSFVSTSAEAGGAILVSGPVEVGVTIRSLGFRNCTAKAGGAIAVRASVSETDLGSASAPILLEQLAFNSSTSTATDGGAIYVLGPAPITVSKVTFDGCSAAGRGGAILFEAANETQAWPPPTAVMTGCRFNGTSAAQGGAIHVSGPVSLSMHQSPITGCRANQGGGLFAKGREDGGGDVAISELVFSSCTAQEGGAFYVDGDLSSLAFRRVGFADNAATVGSGGAGVFMAGGRGSSALTLAGCLFERNNASLDGGALRLDVKALGAFAQQPADAARPFKKTASIAVDQGLVEAGAYFTLNAAGGSGGALKASGWALSTAGVVFVQNRAASQGGAVHASSAASSAVTWDTSFLSTGDAFSENQANRGGAVYALEVNATIRDSSFTNHNASDTGGALFVAHRGSVPEPTRFVADNVTCQGNRAPLAGCLHFFTAAKARQGLHVTRSRILRNSASQGGAVVISAELLPASVPDGSFQEVLLSDSTMADNEAEDSGGGAFVSNNNIVVRNVAFINNTAGKKPPTTQWANSGGAICLAGCQLTRIQDSTFSSNRVTGAGGAVFGTACSADVRNSTLELNTAKVAGGALAMVHVSSSNTLPSLSLDGVTAASNLVLDGNGGGVYAEAVDVTLRSSRLLNNTAAVQAQSCSSGRGGSIAAISAGLLNISSSNISDSQARMSGGALFASTVAAVHVYGSRISGNAANESAGGACALVGNSLVVIEASAIINNTARLSSGGGIHVQVSESGFSPLPDACAGPTSQQGVPRWVLPQRFSVMLSDVELSGNTAELDGGALALDRGCGDVVLQRVQCSRNNARTRDGGAMAVGRSIRSTEEAPAASLATGLPTRVAVTGSRFDSNQALLGEGGAVAVTSAEQQVVLVGVTASGNQALAGGAVSITDGASAAFLDANLTSNAASTDGGAVQAQACAEVHVWGNSTLLDNYAGGRGGALASWGCGVTLLAGADLTQNRALGGGGAVFVSGSSTGSGGASTTTGGSQQGSGSLLLVLDSSLNLNRATGEAVGEGYGGGAWVEGRVAALVADTTFDSNTAGTQGGALLVNSVCDKAPSKALAAANVTRGVCSSPSLFSSAAALLPALLASLGSMRGSACWSTVLHHGNYTGNVAGANGGAMFGTSADSFVLSCDGPTVDASSAGAAWVNDTALGAHVRRLLDERLLNPSSVKQVVSCFAPQLEDGSQSSDPTLFAELKQITRSDARSGYGDFIGALPDKLVVRGVTWSVSQVVSNGTVTARSTDTDSLSVPSPLLSTVSNASSQYLLTTFSNRPMALELSLVDAFGQITRDGRNVNSSDAVPVASVEVRVDEQRNGDGCKLEALGAREVNVYLGTATLDGMRLRAPKGTYRVTLRVSNTEFENTVPDANVTVVIPPCRVGEVPSDDDAVCTPCSALTVSLWQDLTPLVPLSGGLGSCVRGYSEGEVHTCQPCGMNAECPGGAVMFPESGSWHSAANSTYMIQCPNPEACRDGDDGAQTMLQSCQQWWYSRPLGFDYQAYADSVLADNSTGYPDAPGAQPNGTYDLALACALWGLPPGHPASYMERQCSQGYTGNLCGACQSVDGELYASDADFECNKCFSRGASIALLVVFYAVNVFIIVISVLLLFLEDYTQEEELAVGDMLKIVIVHCQYFVIISRLGISWPASITGLAGVAGVITGAVKQVFTPSCLLSGTPTSAEQAKAEVAAGLVAPLILTTTACLLWIVRYGFWHARNASSPAPAPDRRTLMEYRQARNFRGPDWQPQAPPLHYAASNRSAVSNVGSQRGTAQGPNPFLQQHPGIQDSQNGAGASQYGNSLYSQPPPPAGGADSTLTQRHANSRSAQAPSTTPAASSQQHTSAKSLLTPSQALETSRGPEPTPSTPSQGPTPSNRSSHHSGSQPSKALSQGQDQDPRDAPASIAPANSRGRRNSTHMQPLAAVPSVGSPLAPSPSKAYNRVPSVAASIASNGEGKPGKGGKPRRTLYERVRSFFTISDDKDRWAALRNMDRGLALWRQLLLVTMMALFILYPSWAQVCYKQSSQGGHLDLDPSWAQSSLEIFACYYLDDGSGAWPQNQLAQWGRGYWVRDMNQECYAGTHAKLWLPIGIVFIVVVCVGIPLLSFAIMFHHRHQLGTVHVAQCYGSLYRRYKDYAYYWQTITQVQTLLLVVVDVFGRVLPAYQHAMLLQIVLVLTIMFNTYAEPTKFPQLERMEFLSLSVLAVTIALALFFVPPVGRKDLVSAAAANGIGAVVLIINIGICLYFVWVVWTTAHDKLSRFFARAQKRFWKLTRGKPKPIDSEPDIPPGGSYVPHVEGRDLEPLAGDEMVAVTLDDDPDAGQPQK